MDRPHLEFAIPVWNPYIKKDIDVLEKVQRRATKRINGFKDIDYLSRLEKLDLSTLSIRRIRGDLIQMYKINNRSEEINWHRPLSYTSSLSASGPAKNIRGNSYRPKRELVKNCTQRSNFFTNRIVSKWNELPNEAIQSESQNVFKSY